MAKKQIKSTGGLEQKLLRPWDINCPEYESQEQEGCRLKERSEFTSDNEWHIYQAKVFYEFFGEIKKAAEILEKALDQDKENADLMFSLAECYSRNKTTIVKGLELVAKGLERNPQSDYGYTIQSRMELEIGDPLAAYFSAMKALQINSMNFEAGVYLGMIGFQWARSEDNVDEMKYSIENLRTTLSLNPGSERLNQIIAENEDYLREYISKTR